MDAKILHTNEIEKREVLKGATATFSHSENMTIAEWKFEPGTDLPEHTHPHEQITKIISGEFELTINNIPHLLKPGSVAVIPPNAVHSAKSITACHIFDVFNPVREDYR